MFELTKTPPPASRVAPAPRRPRIKPRGLLIDGGEGLGEDPLSGLANLFDLGVVFALGFMVALLSYLGLPELAAKRTAEGGEPVEPAQAAKTKMREGGGRGQGDGHRLGVAYRLASGEVVYVPDGEAPPIEKR